MRPRSSMDTKRSRRSPRTRAFRTRLAVVGVGALVVVGGPAVVWGAGRAPRSGPTPTRREVAIAATKAGLKIAGPFQPGWSAPIVAAYRGVQVLRLEFPQSRAVSRRGSRVSIRIFLKFPDRKTRMRVHVRLLGDSRVVVGAASQVAMWPAPSKRILTTRAVALGEATGHCWTEFRIHVAPSRVRSFEIVMAAD